MIIGLSGKAGSGKDTVADYLVSKYGFKKMAFADMLKITISESFHIPLDYLYDVNLKDKPFSIPFVIKKHYMDNFIERCEKITKSKCKFEFTEKSVSSPRELMQWIGTDVARDNFGSDIWIKALVGKLSEHDNIVVTDCRFDNEIDAINVNGGKSWVIIRNTNRIDEHISENSFMTYWDKFSTVLMNSSTLESLYKNVDQIMEKLC